MEGTLQVLRRGSARVETAEGSFAVARRGLREGMNGDVVQVSLIPMHGKAGERVAYVQSVIERATTTFLGTYDEADPLGVVVPLDARLGHDFFVLPEDKSPDRLEVAAGDVVAARIVEYPQRHAAGVATLERRLGSADELDVHMESVIASFGLATEFGSRALAEARALVLDVETTLRRERDRRDLRQTMCVTVDPADARDFDDAVGARRLTDGGYELDVHIADVTHYLKPGTSLDLEARARTCSVYLADRVLPMLPERLCNDLCSLRPHEDRLAMTVRMRMDRRGAVQEAQAYPSVICSQARLSYDEVDQLLAGTTATEELTDRGVTPPVADMLKTLDEIAQLRLALRRERGAIDFATTEAKVALDDEGHPVGVTVRSRSRATGLIEEAMLLANECVAKMLADHDRQTAYRVHERPSPEDLTACVPALRELGLLGPGVAERLVAAEPFALQEVLAAAEGTSGAFTANALLLRAQKRAIYLPHNDGHYALGAKAYCHFTSPIRRYPDVEVHRALKDLLANRPPRVAGDLPQLCRTCSDQERVADSAARTSQRIKMAEYYADRLGKKYAGIVVGCERYGVFVMLDDTGAEGFVPVRELGDEWFVYSEEHMRLTGESTGRVWRLGQRAAVCVSGVDIAKGRIDFTLASGRRDT